LIGAYSDHAPLGDSFFGHKLGHAALAVVCYTSVAIAANHYVAIAHPTKVHRPSWHGFVFVGNASIDLQLGGAQPVWEQDATRLVGDRAPTSQDGGNLLQAGDEHRPVHGGAHRLIG